MLGGSEMLPPSDGSDVARDRVFRSNALDAPSLKWRDVVGFQGPRRQHQAIAIPPFMYVLGGFSHVQKSLHLYDDIQRTGLTADGAIDDSGWNWTGRLPYKAMGLAAAVYKDHIYLSGGSNDESFYDHVYSTRVDPHGNLIEWRVSNNRLNMPRSNHSMLVTECGGVPFLYVVGGVGAVPRPEAAVSPALKSGLDPERVVHLDTIEFARLLDDGSVGPWRTCAFHLKGGRSAPACFIHDRVLYVTGGWGDLIIDDVFSDVQFANLDVDSGEVDEWHTSRRDTCAPLYGHSAVVLSSPKGAFVALFGGNMGEGNYLDVAQVAIWNEPFQLGRWQLLRSPFNIPRWGHATVALHDKIFLLGGHSRNGDMSDVQEATISWGQSGLGKSLE